jgi:hypothetical protein
MIICQTFNNDKDPTNAKASQVMENNEPLNNVPGFKAFSWRGKLKSI